MKRIVDLSPGAQALADHQRTGGMAVNMGWTCSCGVHCENLAEQFEHQAAEVKKAVLGEAWADDPWVENETIYPGGSQPGSVTE